MDDNLAATGYVRAFEFAVAIARAIAMANAKNRAATHAAVDRVKRELERDISLPRRIARRDEEFLSTLK